MGMPLFINARTDVYLKTNNLSEEEKLAQAILRGKAYKDAGADGLYPIFLKEKNAISTIIKEVELPVNILLLPNIPDFKELKEMGVARLSLGPGLLKVAINAIKNVAEKLLNFDGMNDVAQNPISMNYLKDLIKT